MSSWLNNVTAPGGTGGIAGGFTGVGVLGMQQQHQGGRPQKTMQSVSKMEDPQYLQARALPPAAASRAGRTAP